jgi:DNA polymerase/3'-5' exonuclease PolX
VAEQHLDNRAIAERLDSFAALLELAGANPYSARAYRRAAELIRTTEAPVANLTRAGAHASCAASAAGSKGG